MGWETAMGFGVVNRQGQLFGQPGILLIRCRKKKYRGEDSLGALQVSGSRAGCRQARQRNSTAASP